MTMKAIISISVATLLTPIFLLFFNQTIEKKINKAFSFSNENDKKLSKEELTAKNEEEGALFYRDIIEQLVYKLDVGYLDFLLPIKKPE